MTPDITPSLWHKAIPEARDRLQSRCLVWIALPVLCYLTFSTCRSILTEDGSMSRFLDPSRNTLVKASAVSIAFAFLVWLVKASTPLGAFCGGMMCLLITEFSRSLSGPSLLRSGLTPLALLFVLTFVATRLGRARKAAAGLAESRKGRSASQVFANLGIAALFCSRWGDHLCGWIFTIGSSSLNFGYSGRAGHTLYPQILWLPMLAALAEATADTVSSEMGQVFGGRPIMLTTFRSVPPGTDGAITVFGSVAGITSAALIALIAIPALGMSLLQCAIAFGAGVAGLFFDSLLGATIERKGWLGNDLVNLLSTAFAALISLIAVRFAQRL